MANVLVFVDRWGPPPAGADERTGPALGAGDRHAAASGASLQALAEARRMADAVGATVYALVLVSEAALDADATGEVDALAHQLGRGGADRVLVCGQGGLEHGPLDATQGRLLQAVASTLRPLVVLFGIGEAAEELAPPLALRTGAVYFPQAALDLAAATPDPDRRPLLRRWRARGDGQRVLDVVGCERAVVATLGGRRGSAHLGDAVEAEVLSTPAGEAPDPVRRLPAEGDLAVPPPHPSTAQTVIVVGAPAGEEALSTLRAAAPGDVIVLDEAQAREAQDLCPEQLVVVAPSDVSALPGWHPCPAATVVLAGPRTSAPVPSLVQAVWPTNTARAVAAIAEELRRRGSLPAAARGR